MKGREITEYEKYKANLICEYNNALWILRYNEKTKRYDGVYMDKHFNDSKGIILHIKEKELEKMTLIDVR